MRSVLDIATIESKMSLTKLLNSLPNSTYEILQITAKKYPEKTAITYLPCGSADKDPITINYQQLLTRVNQTANLFSELGITAQKTVSYVLPNIPENYFVLFGAEAVGIANAISPELSPQQIADILFKADSELLVTVGFVPPIWNNVLNAREIYRKQYKKELTILVIGGSADKENKIDSFDALLKEQSTSLQSSRMIAPTDVCAYFHSSGTTGEPKLAALTHQNKIFSAWAVNTCFSFNEEDVFLNAMPLFHVAAPMLFGLVPFMHSANMVLMSPMGWMDPNVSNNFWKIVEKYKGTVTAALPVIYGALLHSANSELEYTNKNSLRLAISGSALPPEDMAQFKKLNPALWISGIYGSTEVTCIANFIPQNRQSEPDLMGIPLPNTQVKIMKMSEPNKECAVGEVGVIYVKGPHVTAGYKKPGEKISTQAENNEWRSGDLGRQNANGSFSIICRVIDMIYGKDSAGKEVEISALEIENKLREHPDVAMVGVIGQPDEDRIEIPRACIELKPNSKITAEALQQWCVKNITCASHVPVIVIESKLPINGMGKVIKPLLREKAEMERRVSMPLKIGQ